MYDGRIWSIEPCQQQHYSCFTGLWNWTRYAATASILSCTGADAIIPEACEHVAGVLMAHILWHQFVWTWFLSFYVYMSLCDLILVSINLHCCWIIHWRIIVINIPEAEVWLISRVRPVWHPDNTQQVQEPNWAKSSKIYTTNSIQGLLRPIYWE